MAFHGIPFRFLGTKLAKHPIQLELPAEGFRPNVRQLIEDIFLSERESIRIGSAKAVSHSPQFNDGIFDLLRLPNLNAFEFADAVFAVFSFRIDDLRHIGFDHGIDEDCEFLPVCSRETDFHDLRISGKFDLQMASKPIDRVGLVLLVLDHRKIADSR